MRLGEGPRARLRFDAKVVADAVAAFDRCAAPPEPPKSTARRRHEMSLIQFERLD
jgi:hypothetical protein